MNLVTLLSCFISILSSHCLISFWLLNRIQNTLVFIIDSDDAQFIKLVSYTFSATLEIVLNWKAWRSLVCSQMIRHVLKFAVAIGWLIILPVTYSSSIQNPTGLIKFFSNWIGNFQSQSIYNFAVAIYMLPNIFSALFFVFLPIRRALERSNSRVVRFLLWWTQVYIHTRSST